MAPVTKPPSSQDSPRATPSPKARAAAERQARLAAELRTNLKKRKARAKGGDGAPSQPSGEEGESR